MTIPTLPSTHQPIPIWEHPNWMALTICNPYPEMILNGEKPIENRNWMTSYRGPLFIHAGMSKLWMAPGYQQRFQNLTYGAIVGIVTLADCLEITAYTWPSEFQHLKTHEHANGRFCWMLTNVKRFAKPVPCAGALGLWNVRQHKQAPRIVPLVVEQLQAVA